MAVDALFQVARTDWGWDSLGGVCRRGGGDIQTGPFGSQLHASDYVPFGIPSIMPQNISQARVSTEGIARISPTDARRLSRYLLKTGDIVYSRRGDAERRALITERENGWLCGTGCLRVRFGDGIVVPQFALYCLSHPASREWVVRHAVGATMPNLNTSILGALPFLLPPLPDQLAIAEVLGTLDDKIESNRRTSRTLERVARAIFRAWFVDFEPVKAKAAGGRSFPGMPQEAFAALPTRFVESELGPVPEGWRVLPLDEAVEVNPPRRLAKGVPAPYLDMGQMPTDGHAPRSWVEREAGSGARFMNGDTLVARITPCLENGKTAYVDFLGEAQVGWGSTEYIVLRPKPPIPNLYAYLLARTPEFRAFAIQKMTGSSGRQRVPFDTMGKFNVAIGPAPVMQVFGEAVEPLFSRSSASFRESRSLAALRDYLLPKLLRGEVRVAADSVCAILEPAAAARERRPGHE